MPAEPLLAQGVIVGSRQRQIDMVRALDVLELKPVICKTFALADLADAFRYENLGNEECPALRAGLLPAGAACV